MVISASDITTGTLATLLNRLTAESNAVTTTTHPLRHRVVSTTARMQPTAAAITYTLPTPVAGKQICTKELEHIWHTKYRARWK